MRPRPMLWKRMTGRSGPPRNETATFQCAFSLSAPGVERF